MSHDRNQQQPRCVLCRRILRPGDSLSVAGVGHRCYRCFNDETADQLGVAFDNTAIAPFAITDVDGVLHRFEIRSMLVATGHAMHAREVGKRGAIGRLSVRDSRWSRGRLRGVNYFCVRQI